MDFQNVVINVVQLFIMIFAGYGAVGLKWIKKEAQKYYSNFLYYICIPTLIIYSLSNSDPIPSNVMVQVVIALIVTYGVQSILGLVLPKILKIKVDYQGIYGFYLIFGNVCFIGFPVAVSILGEEALFYAVMLNIPFNILVYTLGVYLISRDVAAGAKFDFKKFINPGTIAVIIGMIMYGFQWHLPTVLNGVFLQFSNITIPLSLFVIGNSLYGIKFISIFKKLPVIAFSLIKLLIIPAILAVIMYLIKADPLLSAVTVILGGMPVASLSVILAEEYNGRVQEASEGVFMSTLLLAVSIPFLVFLTTYLFY